MFLAINLFTNWIFWVVLIAVVIIGAIIAVNVIINAKIKEIERKDVAEKEKNLRIKLGLEEANAVKDDSDDSVEEISDKEEEETEETVESIEEVQEEKAEEPVEEVQEEKVEEPVEEAQEKKVEEPVEEVQEEKVEEPVEEAQEKKVEEPVEKVQEEKAEEPVEETVEDDAEDLLKDIPDADEMEKELDKKKAEEEKANEEKIKIEEQAQKNAEEEAQTKFEEEKTMSEKKTQTTQKAKAETKKTTPVTEKPVAQAKKTAPKQANGKWLLVPESEGYYFGKLFASNGELLLQTERYKGISGLKSGIETIKKNIEKDNFEITVDKNKTYNFKLFASNHGLLCIGEGYTSRENALSAINSVKNFSTSLSFVSDEAEAVEDKKFKIAEKDKNENGKWVIFEDADGYTHAELKANNGQVLFVTEQYKGINSLRSGLDSIRKNITNGNFSMRKDKNDNFNFKIFSENKRLLGLGAGYSSATNCESAILSVMKFCDSMVVFNNSDEIDE